MSDTRTGLTPEQSSALTQLFEAMRDGDQMRIESALRQLEFLVDVQGIWSRAA